MSSHHIVRDEQEPALLVLNAAWLSNETLASLLEWSPTLLVPASQVEALVAMDIRPDVIIATKAEREELGVVWEELAPLIILERSEGEHPLLSILHFLLVSKHRAVNVLDVPDVGAMSDIALFPDNLHIVFYSETSRWLWVRSGTFKKWLPAGTKLTVHPVTPASDLHFSGFRENGRVSNMSGPVWAEVENDQLVAISCSRPFLLEEPL